MHEVVISFPAGGGYGGPTVFFMLQAAAIALERSALARRLGLGRGWRGWLFACAALVLPVGLLFHAPFLRNVVLPFLQALGAVP